MVEGLTKWNKSNKIIILTGFQAAIAAIKKTGKMGKTRTDELRKVIRRFEEGKREFRPIAVSLR